MAIFSKQELHRLLQVKEKTSISIFLPTHRRGAQTQQDPIRLKNLLSQAAQKLIAYGLEPDAAHDFLEPVWQLVNQHEYWQHQSQGLAIFMTEHRNFIYRLPIQFQESVYVGQQFYIRPLLPLLNNNGQYYVLAASQNCVRFFRADRDSIEAIELDNMPQSSGVALKYDDPEQQLQYHSLSNRSLIYHGQGATQRNHKIDILRFFQQVDQAVSLYLSNQDAPLVFVGVDYLYPIYTEANRYAHLCEQPIATNPDQLSAQDIHQMSWHQMESIFQRKFRDLISTHCDQLKTEMTCSDLLDILIAAHNGQVATLFLPYEKEIWGRFDAQQRRLDIHDQASDTDELLNLAAIYTLFCSGEVYAIAPHDIPGGKQIAATLRYPLLALQGSAVSR